MVMGSWAHERGHNRSALAISSDGRTGSYNRTVAPGSGARPRSPSRILDRTRLSGAEEAPSRGDLRRRAGLLERVALDVDKPRTRLPLKADLQAPGPVLAGAVVVGAAPDSMWGKAALHKGTEHVQRAGCARRRSPSGRHENGYHHGHGGDERDGIPPLKRRSLHAEVPPSRAPRREEIIRIRNQKPQGLWGFFGPT